jgi:hypothetical protein
MVGLAAPLPLQQQQQQQQVVAAVPDGMLHGPSRLRTRSPPDHPSDLDNFLGLAGDPLGDASGAYGVCSEPMVGLEGPGAGLEPATTASLLGHPQQQSQQQHQQQLRPAPAVKAEPGTALPCLPVHHLQPSAAGGGGAAEGAAAAGGRLPSSSSGPEGLAGGVAPYCSSPLKRLALAPPAVEGGVGSPLKRPCRLPAAPLLPEPPSFNTLIAGEASEEDLLAWAAGGGSSGALGGSTTSLNGLLTARTGSCPLGSYLELPAVLGGEALGLGAGGGNTAASAAAAAAAAAAGLGGGGAGEGQGL